MQSDTETESEPESPSGSNDEPIAVLQYDGLIYGMEDALVAVERIKKIDSSVLQQDTSLHIDILKASSSIIRFLDDCCALPLDARRKAKAVSYFPHLVDVTFLSCLFDHRKASQNIAARSLKLTAAAPTVVCWVDVVLAKLSVLAVTIASGFSPKMLGPRSGHMRPQREDDCIRAATQLPERWRSMIDVVASKQTSPGAMRLALRLLFASYVMRPQLYSCESWTDSDVLPEDMMSAMLRSINQKPLNGFPSLLLTYECDEDERTNGAITLSLFSTSQVVYRKTHPEGPRSPVRTQSFGYFLDMIQRVIGRKILTAARIATSYRHIDLAQAILVRWGCLVPWSWATWDDQRTANVELITDLTIMWLYHLNSPFCGLEEFSGFKVPFQLIMADNKASSSAAMLQVLYQTTTQMRQNRNLGTVETICPLLAVVLRKSCWAVVHLLKLNREKAEPQIQQRMPMFCQCLAGLFVMLGNKEQELNIKALILESLTLVEPQALRSSLQTFREDASSQFHVRLDEAIILSKRNLDYHADLIDTNPTSSNVTISHLGVKYVLDFLAILWQSKIEGLIIDGTVSSLLTSIMKSYRSRPSILLRDSFLTALAFMERYHMFDGTDPLNEEFIWNVTMPSGSTDLIAAAAFAHFLTETSRSFSILHYAEAWDYLRDVLLLSLPRYLVQEDEALALLICPVLCVALAKILQAASPATDFMHSSPWTMSLCTDLLSLTDGNAPPSNFANLHQRLEKAGKMLLDQISREVQQVQEPLVRGTVKFWIITVTLTVSIMASIQTRNRRRRSHSTSTISSTGRSPDDSWRMATKRAYPRPLRDASSSHKWDVDVWRKEKRRRRDIPPQFFETDNPPSVLGDRHNTTAPLTPSFATTSAEFHLFPPQECQGGRPYHLPQPYDAGSMEPTDLGDNDFESLSTLRSNAFWELRRSVAESGEGLVQRMRDYEHLRSRSDVYLKARETQRRGRKRTSLALISRKLASLQPDSEDSEDEVQIFAGELPRISCSSGPSKDKRYLSRDLMDEGPDPPKPFPFAARKRSTSQGENSHSDSSSSMYHSDDNASHTSSATSPHMSQSLFSSSYPFCTPFTPTLSHTLSESAASSLMSLPLPSISPLPLPLPPSSASRSEKAIAALSLAMTNGAGSLADYEALLAIQASPTLDNCQVGEMWH